MYKLSLQEELVPSLEQSLAELANLNAAHLFVLFQFTGITLKNNYFLDK